jgi:hypothetical protein
LLAALNFALHLFFAKVFGFALDAGDFVQAMRILQ